MPDPIRSINGKIGAYESWKNTADRTARTAPARAAFERRFDAFPDPESARKAYYLRLAAKSAEARRKNRRGGGATAPDAA